METNINSSPILSKNFLVVDNTLSNKANELALQINEKYAKNKENSISADDVLIIIESIFRGVPVAVKNGSSVKVPSLGKFCIKNKRYRYLPEEIKEELNKVHSIPNDIALKQIIETQDCY